MFDLLGDKYRKEVAKFPVIVIHSYFGVKVNSLYFLKETADKYKPMQQNRALGHFAKTDSLLRTHLNDEQAIPLLIMQLCAL